MSHDPHMTRRLGLLIEKVPGAGSIMGINRRQRNKKESTRETYKPCCNYSWVMMVASGPTLYVTSDTFSYYIGDWFAPRFPAPASPSALEHSATAGLAEYVLETVNTTATALAGAAVDEVKKHFASNNGTGVVGDSRMEWTGMGLEWLRSLLGRREWTLPCVDVKVRL
ncbi:hypothetical protein GX51_03677 [Blastomyces parvus]|uniref:Uncharacterized protein n=1 Tax=Blastomyces parvus TaxID=2060905 RepID=A0A2B7X5N7_9EURO|nr:hypothetical protein GX51_03677 [Blastomyces parvus]